MWARYDREFQKSNRNSKVTHKIMVNGELVTLPDPESKPKKPDFSSLRPEYQPKNYQGLSLSKNFERFRWNESPTK